MPEDLIMQIIWIGIWLIAGLAAWALLYWMEDPPRKPITYAQMIGGFFVVVVAPISLPLTLIGAIFTAVDRYGSEPVFKEKPKAIDANDQHLLDSPEPSRGKW